MMKRTFILLMKISVEKEDIDSTGIIVGLVEFGEHHSIALFRLNVLLCVLNIIFILAGIYGFPYIALPTLTIASSNLSIAILYLLSIIPLATLAALVVLSLLRKPGEGGDIKISEAKAGSHNIVMVKHPPVKGNKCEPLEIEEEEKLVTRYPTSLPSSVETSSRTTPTDKQGKLAEFIVEHAVMVFWFGIFCSAITILLLLLCLFGVPSFNFPNIYSIKPFGWMCLLFACIVKCLA